MAENVNNIVVGIQGENTIKIGAYGAAESAAVDVGVTKNGIDLQYTSTEYPIEVDQHLGEVRLVTTKEEQQLTIRLAEASLENLATALGLSTTSVDSGTLNFGDRTANQEDYKTIYINVKGSGATTATRKYTFHKCKLIGDNTHSYTKNGETLLELTFKVLADTTKTAAQRFGSIVNIGSDTTAPVIALTAPADGGTVTKDTKGTVVWTITEANAMDENTIVYGNTFSIINTTTPGSATLVPGTIAYDATAKTVMFTPTNNWKASDTFQAIVTTGLRDANGNALAATKIEQFSATS